MNPSNNNTPINQISDIGLASFLLSKGHELIDIIGRGGRRHFVFKRSPRIRRDSICYLNRAPGSAVPARDYYENLRTLKASITDDNISVWRNDERPGRRGKTLFENRSEGNQ